MAFLIHILFILPYSCSTQFFPLFLLMQCQNSHQQVNLTLTALSTAINKNNYTHAPYESVQEVNIIARFVLIILLIAVVNIKYRKFITEENFDR